MHTRQFEPLSVGQQCWLQHPSSGEWYTQAVILASRGSDSYFIRTTDGSEYLRGRRLLRPVQLSASVNHIKVIMPKQNGQRRYRDHTSELLHYHDLDNWSRLPPPPPLTLNLRDIRNVSVCNSGCVSGTQQAGGDQESRVSESSGERLAHHKQSRRVPLSLHHRSRVAHPSDHNNRDLGNRPVHDLQEMRQVPKQEHGSGSPEDYAGGRGLDSEPIGVGSIDTSPIPSPSSTTQTTSLVGDINSPQGSTFHGSARTQNSPQPGTSKDIETPRRTRWDRPSADSRPCCLLYTSPSPRDS